LSAERSKASGRGRNRVDETRAVLNATRWHLVQMRTPTLPTCRFVYRKNRDATFASTLALRDCKHERTS
jgi:hypothetical protein